MALAQILSKSSSWGLGDGRSRATVRAVERVALEIIDQCVDAYATSYKDRSPAQDIWAL